MQLVANNSFDYALTDDEMPKIMIPGPGFVYAPVTAGADAGFAHICIDGESVGKVPLVYGETIEKAPEEEKTFWERLIGGD